jgi:hypothetical protein
MNQQISLVKITLCGPKDVITEWNLRNGESRGFWIKHQHWATDSHPDLADRAQGIINRQIIDESDIIVAIFWSRFGSPTSIAKSGTEEEIRRGVRLGQKVMVYFSDLEPLPADADKNQIDQLCEFRRFLNAQGLCWRFSSRAQFRQDFARHLAFKLNHFEKPLWNGVQSSKSQVISGDNNVQIGGDVHHYHGVKKVKKVISRPDGGVSAQELRKIKQWIEELAEGEIGVSRPAAFGKWGAILLNSFDVDKREELLSVQMPDVKTWFLQHRAMQTQGQRTKAPDIWRKKRITAIKAAMGSLGLTNEAYYPQLAQKLRMKKAFTSLKHLTNRDLERVYRKVMEDARQL